MNKKVDILLEKLELSEQISEKKNATDVVKDSEIESLKIRNKRLVDDNKTLKADLKEVAKDLNLSKLENRDSTQKLERKIEVLEDDLKTQILKSNEDLKEHEVEREELKALRDKSNIQIKEACSQTNSYPDIPYKITDPLPPIFSMQLCHKSRPIHFLSRSIPNLNSILWCPPDDKILDAAEEYLSEQYDREIEEFYLQALEAHEAGPHGQQEHQSVPD